MGRSISRGDLAGNLFGETRASPMLLHVIKSTVSGLRSWLLGPSDPATLANRRFYALRTGIRSREPVAD